MAANIIPSDARDHIKFVFPKSTLLVAQVDHTEKFVNVAVIIIGKSPHKLHDVELLRMQGNTIDATCQRCYRTLVLCDEEWDLKQELPCNNGARWK